MAEQISLEQALFGYRDGHNLLATSTPLSARARQFLATVTDSSGPENVKGFGRAFTGLPVPETDFYAVFCTWPAPEMSRPGCVWSHVILTRLSDLARLPQLDFLRNMFARPSLPLVTRSYEHYTAPVNPQVTTREEEASTSRERVSCLLQALYGNPKNGIVVLDEESSRWERPVFDVWAQQWPRLRREFAFSTGSLSDRRLGGIDFDLQIAPLATERLWHRCESPTDIVNYQTLTHDKHDSPIPHWLHASLADFDDRTNNPLRHFMFSYASDIDRPRAAFAALATAYTFIKYTGTIEWADLLSFIGSRFPKQSEAVRLKRDLVSIPGDMSPSERVERAWGIASFLLERQESAAYPLKDYDCEGLGLQLWKERPHQTMELLSHLVRHEESVAAATFAKGVARAVDSGVLTNIADAHAELIPLFARHNPGLGFEVQTWKLRPHVQIQVYETLVGLSLTHEEWGRIVGAMFVAATHVSVREAVFLAGPYAMPGAFRWLQCPLAGQMLPSHHWRDALASAALEWLAHNTALAPAQLALSAWCAPPEGVRRTLSAKREDVRFLSDDALSAVPGPFREYMAFLLMSLGLRESSEVGTNLILSHFFTVHAALLSGNYSSEVWWLLSPDLPSIGWWRDWDRCEKLRLAVKRYLSQHGGCKQLFKAAKSPSERKLARKVADIEDDSSEFVD